VILSRMSGIGMNHKKRVALTIQRQRADRIPRGELCIDDGVVGAFLHVPHVTHRERLEFASRMDLDLICLSSDYGAGTRPDRLPAPDTLCWPDLAHWSVETDLFVFVMMDGGFSWGMKLLGFKDFMTAIMRRLPAIESILQEVDALNTVLMERAAAQGAHGVVIADDIAFTAGTMVAPDVLRRVFFPSVARQVECAHNLGLSVIFHSDGNLNSVLDDLAATGVDGLQCLEKAAGMDLARTRKQYGDRLCFWGNLDPSLLTAPLDPLELEQQVRAVIHVANQGGIIFGTSSGLFKGMRPENLSYLHQLLSRQPCRLFSHFATAL
jgi:uroporphyrinogen decarboxylase